MIDSFPDLIIFEIEGCMCGHSDKDHFSLGCCRCSCTFYMTWDEYDRENQDLLRQKLIDERDIS